MRLRAQNHLSAFLGTTPELLERFHMFAHDSHAYLVEIES